MGVLVVVTNGKKYLLKNFTIFLLLISFGLLVGCSFPFTSIFTVKPSLPIDQDSPDSNTDNQNNLDSNADNQTSNQNNSNNDTNSDSNNQPIINEDLVSNLDKEKTKGNVKYIGFEDLDNEHLDNIDDKNSDSLDDNDNNNRDQNEGTNSDKDMNPHNDNDSESNNDIDNTDNETNETEQDENSSKHYKTEAVPAAKIIKNSPNKELKRVALTFDDGPDAYFTPQVLDILKEYDVKATFFILGIEGNKNRDVLKRIDEEGHVVASHSWNHSNFTKISKKKAIDELQRTNQLIEEVTGKPNSLFRLPYGAYNRKVLEIIAEQGFHNIHWSIDPRDWSGISSKKILNHIKENLEPGAIILLHSSRSSDSIPNTIKALPQIIEYLHGQGYELVTVPELLEDVLEVNTVEVNTKD
jgi:peptidoglycan/xylan/chitin deacetylase (PgdA/CDA1 family)